MGCDLFHNHTVTQSSHTLKNVCSCPTWLNTQSRTFTGNKSSSTIFLSFLLHLPIKTIIQALFNLPQNFWLLGQFFFSYYDYKQLLLTLQTEPTVWNLVHGCNLVLFSIIFISMYVGRQKNIVINAREVCQIDAYLECLCAPSNVVNIWLLSSEA